MNKKFVFIILITFIGLLLLGCNDNRDFKSAYEQFWESYYKATDFYQPDDKRLEALEKMDSDKVEAELKNMNDALNILSNKMETEREKSTYEALNRNYDDLKYLVSIYDKFDSLSDDEKMDVEDKLVGVFINRSTMEKEKD